MIHIVTDSTSDLPEGFAEQYSIPIIPLHINFGDQEYRDGVDLTPDEFYEKIRSTNDFPVTSAPTVAEFCDIYQQFDDKNTVLSIHISSKMSQTVSHALKAVQICDTGAKIHVIDSLNASFGLGNIVLAAQRMIQNQVPVDTILRRLEQIIQRNQVIFAVPNLDFLKRGGRIGQARSMVGKLLGYKPILGTRNGEIVALSKVKDRKHFPQEIVKLMKQHLDGATCIRGGVFHVHAEAAMETLREHIEDTFNCVELVTARAGAVIGSHTGYGAIAVAYYAAEDDA
ncbi:MAG: DegV family protein [Gemmatimonadetes bacterium]|nr:MAG: DegV family protein [Gemmatimonadota bacterium]